MLMSRWSKKESDRFFLIAVFVYIYPLVSVGYFYVEDNLRSITGYDSWSPEGRPLIAWFYHALSLSGGIPNAYPLALFLAVVVMAFALSSLMKHYFSDANLCSAIVVLPMFYSPLFLSNLTYQYDGPLMVLGMSAAIAAMTFKHQGRGIEWAVSCGLVYMFLAIYQPILNVYIGLCCIEVYRKLVKGDALFDVAKFVMGKLLQMVSVVVIYRLSVEPFLDQSRREMIALDSNGFHVVWVHVLQVEEKIRPLYTGGSRCLFIVMTALAVVGYLWDGLRALKLKEKGTHKVIVGVLYLSIAPLLIALVPGFLLFFLYGDNGSRLMVGAAPLLVFMLLLTQRLLNRVHRFGPVLLILPILMMLSTSYSYGRVLSLKKELETTLMQSLAYSISSSAQLRTVEKFYFSYEDQRYWLPASQGTVSTLPIIPYVMAADFSLWPLAMPRVGITNIVWADEQHSTAALLQRNPQPVMDNMFYSIYRVGGDGYIIMKNMNLPSAVNFP